MRFAEFLVEGNFTRDPACGKRQNDEMALHHALGIVGDGLAIAGGGAQIMVSAGSMSDAASGMWDGSLLRMIWQAGAGRGLAILGL